MVKTTNKTKRDWKKIGVVTLYVALPVVMVTLGVVGTLKYQSFIDNVKADGVAQYKLTHCDKYTDKKQTTSWLECDE